MLVILSVVLFMVISFVCRRAYETRLIEQSNTLSFKCPLFRRSFVNLALSSSVITTIFPLMPDQTSI